MQALNPTVLQFFHWYFPLEGNRWNHAAAEADDLAGLGITDAWLPPAYKSALGNVEPGYAVYDLYDLGEFNQKNTVITKYGTRDEYVAAIEALHKHQIRVLADIVLNHKHGGDEPETITIKKVNPQNRVECIGDAVETQAATRFTFPEEGANTPIISGIINPSRG
jgi:alpha-amylase